MILDEDSSNLNSSDSLTGKNIVIEVLKKSLLKWIVPQNITGKVILILRVS